MRSSPTFAARHSSAKVAQGLSQVLRAEANRDPRGHTTPPTVAANFRASWHGLVACGAESVSRAGATDPWAVGARRTRRLLRADPDSFFLWTAISSPPCHVPGCDWVYGRLLNLRRRYPPHRRPITSPSQVVWVCLQSEFCSTGTLFLSWQLDSWCCVELLYLTSIGTCRFVSGNGRSANPTKFLPNTSRGLRLSQREFQANSIAFAPLNTVYRPQNCIWIGRFTAWVLTSKGYTTTNMPTPQKRVHSVAGSPTTRTP